MPCQYAVACNGIMCACEKGFFGGKPSHGTCVRCEHNTDPAWHANKIKEMLESQPKTVPIAPQTPIQPISRDKWPIGVKLIAEARKPEDKGVGDTVHRLIPKADELIAWMKRLGIDCRCPDRRVSLNQRFPYQ